MTSGHANSPYTELQHLIEDNVHRELECRMFLKYARDLLVKVTSHTFVEEAEEYRGHTGDSDYLIVCNVCDEAGIESRQAYLWEAKAPQCFLFEEDTQNRVKPTSQFISAENQLLHYYEEAKQSGLFRSEFGITHPENVNLGGIIIGSKNTLVKTQSYSQITINKLYERALKLRTRYLYGSCGIKVVIWNTILDYLGTPEPPRQMQVTLKSSISITGTTETVVTSYQ